jgi:hypothetical protein
MSGDTSSWTIIYTRIQVYLNKFLLGVTLLSLLSGCIPVKAGEETLPSVLPVPTLNSIFTRSQKTISPTAIIAVSSPVLPTLESTVEPETPQAATPFVTPIPVALQSVVVYDEKLNDNWSLGSSTGILRNLQDTTSPHNGIYALSMTPTIDEASLFFSVQKDAKEIYLRDQIWGVRFWLYSGNSTIGTDDLGVTVFGSNQYPYWVWNDNSVENVYDPKFSFTRLYYLDINRSIPPNTWVQIEVWLDKLQFDPVYKYVTGFVIKNGEGFRDTVYIDQVELVKAPETP